MWTAQRPPDMPPLIFQLMAVLIAVMALAMAAFLRRMSSWRMRGPGGGRIEPTGMRLVLMRVMGVVVAGIALLMAFGGPALLV
jgi:hypothetical protein